MLCKQSSARPVSRAARFLELRDAIEPYLECDQVIEPVSMKISIGLFLIRYSVLARTHESRRNIQIWPPGVHECGTHIHGNKVANVSWHRSDKVELVTFRAGLWQGQLLLLLTAGGSMVREIIGKSAKDGKMSRLTIFT